MLPTLDQVQTVGVIGAGTMGHGIAHVAALSGTQVHLYDATRGAAQAGLAKITKNLEKGVELGYVRPADRDVALARIRVFDELAPTWARRLRDSKRSRRCSISSARSSGSTKIVSPHALLATNTSLLPVGEIAKTLRNPSRFVGMHFSTPST
jgi:3-hydroxybutyryl-CoA dehydrogenase